MADIPNQMIPAKLAELALGDLNNVFYAGSVSGANSILLIAEKVICGFGRTDEWFGSQTFADLKRDGLLKAA